MRDLPSAIFVRARASRSFSVCNDVPRRKYDVRQSSTKLALAAGLGILAAAPLLGAQVAQATPVLLAEGALTGTTDLSGLTGTLENGLPANILGGRASGLAYAGGNPFRALPDRGPNATPYN